MAVNTTFTEEELKTILKDYKIGNFISLAAITKGTVQTNYLITTNLGKYVFKFYNNREHESVLCESEIVNYLTSNDFPCPKIIPKQDGNNVAQYRERSYIIYKFVEGIHSSKLNKNQLDALIKTVADLHTISPGFIPEHLVSRMNYSPELSIRLAEENSKKLKTVDAKEKLEWLKRIASSLDLPDSLPKQISHGDLEPSNILFKGDRIVALIDFDDANYTYSTFDLVGLIEHIAWIYDADKTLDWIRAQSVIQKYMKHILLSSLEKKHLFDVYKLGVMIDCIWNYERGEAADFYEKRKIEFLDGVGRNTFYSKLFSSDG